MTLLTYTSYAQDVIDTGRPSYSENEYLVAPGSVQFENGLGYSYNKNRVDYSIPDVAARFGISKKIEGRVTSTLIASQNSNIETRYQYAFDNIFIGLKYQFVKNKGLLPGLATVARYGFRDQTKDLQFIIDNALGRLWNITNNIGYTLSETENKQMVSYIICVSFSVTNKLGFFIENFNFFHKEGFDNHAVHIGLQRLINTNMQYDFSVATYSMTKWSNYFLQMGFSFRIDLKKGKTKDSV